MSGRLCTRNLSVSVQCAVRSGKKICALEELFVGDTVLVLLCAGLAGEELGELLVEIDKILGVLPAFKLILIERIRNGMEGCPTPREKAHRLKQ